MTKEKKDEKEITDFKNTAESIDMTMALMKLIYDSAVKFGFSQSEAMQFALATYVRFTGGAK